MLHSPAGSPINLPGFWGRFKTPKNKEAKLQQSPPQMQVSAPRLLTLVFMEMETIRMLPNTFAELDHQVREWIKPPEGAQYALRVPIEFASWDAARVVSSPWIYITGEDSYQIAIQGVRAFKVEIIGDGPPPVEEPPYVSSSLNLHATNHSSYLSLPVRLPLPPSWRCPEHST
ncbi:hypothetical protein QCA50_003011 [Cerrena zonata]|uniref:Uncharacterized protein n=1 Tax=Cerrena zonata TaxID=2478898 RepID=A0AAW0GJA6_9APHY